MRVYLNDYPTFHLNHLSELILNFLIQLVYQITENIL